MNLFNDIDASTFLTHYWQKKPYVFKGALSGFELPIEVEELAGLAYDEQIESRLIQEQTTSEGKASNWLMKQGPLNEDDFTQLPPSHWTLLLQAVDQFIPELADLKHLFRFLPDWRVDDIMASVSPNQGSVGPHFDFYDVFLIQAEGRREWRIGQMCDESSSMLDDCPLKILTDFQQQESWLLEPGDVLYVPPKLAHYGIALEQGVTLSMGFRALSHGEMLDSFAAFMADRIPESKRYEDPNPTPARNPGRIEPEVLKQVKQILIDAIDDQLLGQWFGEVMTEPKYSDQEFKLDPPAEFEELAALINGAEVAYKTDDTRMSYLENDGAFTLFVNSESINIVSEESQALAAQLCNEWQLKLKTWETYTQDEQILMLQLFNLGSIEF